MGTSGINGKINSASADSIDTLRCFLQGNFQVVKCAIVLLWFFIVATFHLVAPDMAAAM